MKKTLVNESLNEYRFEATNDEVAQRVWECLSSTNPELRPKDVHRAKYSREFVAEYHRSDGEDVKISVGIPNLKRYLGAYILAFVDGGLWFNRRLKRNEKKLR